MKSIGLYPRVRTDTAATKVVSQAGAVSLVETVRAAGLDRGLSQALGRWRKPLARHDPGKVVTDLALALAVGGDCLADVAVLRDQPGVFGSVASDPTVSRLVDTLAADADRALAAIDAARAAARARVWSAAGEHAPDSGAQVETPVVIDVDATLVTAHSEKENAAPTFKKGFGFHPLLTFADHGQDGTGEPLSVMLRKGNAGSNTAADHIAVLKAAFAQLPGHKPGRRPGRSVLVRADGAGATHELLSWLTAQRVQYSVGFSLPDTFAEQLALLDKAELWQPAYDGNGQIRPGRSSPRPPGCSTSHPGRPGCASSSAKNARTPARNCGSPTTTAIGSPPLPPTPPAANSPTSNSGTADAPGARTASASPRTYMMEIAAGVVTQQRTGAETGLPIQ